MKIRLSSNALVNAVACVMCERFAVFLRAQSHFPVYQTEQSEHVTDGD